MFGSIVAPNGISASCANLKHCKPNGIPTIVKHQIMPIDIDSNISSHPKTKSHIIFQIKLVILPEYLICLPKGQIINVPNLKHCIPVGIASIVQQHKIPTMYQARAIKPPPKNNHNTFPIVFKSMSPLRD